MSLWASCCLAEKLRAFHDGPIVLHRRAQASTRRETPSCATFRCRRDGRAGSHADRHCHGLHAVPAEPTLQWRRSLILEGRNKCHVYACCSSIHPGSSGHAACLSNMLLTAWKCGNTRGPEWLAGLAGGVKGRSIPAVFELFSLTLFSLCCCADDSLTVRTSEVRRRQGRKVDTCLLCVQGTSHQRIHWRVPQEESFPVAGNPVSNPRKEHTATVASGIGLGRCKNAHHVWCNMSIIKRWNTSKVLK